MNKKLLTLPLVMAPLLASCGSNSSTIIVNTMLNIRISERGEMIIFPFCVTKKAFSVKAGEQKTFKIKYIHTFPYNPFKEIGHIPQILHFSSKPLDPNIIYNPSDIYKDALDAISEINDYKINNIVINKSSAISESDWFDNLLDGIETNSYFFCDDGDIAVIESAFEGEIDDSINETITITFKKDFENIYMNVCQYLDK